jgi:23S rRNA pseudouridine2605 synthase
MTDQTQRLDKFLANAGIASRRSIKDLLKYSQVTVNGKRVHENGTRIVPGKDDIKVDGKKIKNKGMIYYLLNKPVGVISTSDDELGRKNVIDLIETSTRVYPVGRLDKDTHGAILLTNDGELTHKLTHPKYHVPKRYLLQIKGSVSEGKIQKLRDGVVLSDGITNPAKVKIVRSTERQTTLEIEIFEGRYRQIRRMCEAIFLNLVDLRRTDFGPIPLGNLKEGQYRELTKEEVNQLKKAVEKTF